MYGSQWVSSLASQMPNGDAFNSGTVITTASSNTVNITTNGGMSLMHFAKTVAWGKSIFGQCRSTARGLSSFHCLALGRSPLFLPLFVCQVT